MKISANVIVELDFEKNYLSFTGLRVGETQTKSLRIIAKDSANLKLGKPETEAPGVKAKIVREAGKDGKPAYRIDVSMTPEKAGPVRGEIKVSANHPKKKELKLRLSGRVTGDIALSPERVSIRKEVSKKAPRKVKVSSKKKPFKILKVEDPSGRVVAKVETLKKGMEYELSLSITEKGMTEAANFSASLKILTDSKEQKELRLPVYVRSKRSVGIGKGKALKRLKPDIKKMLKKK